MTRVVHWLSPSMKRTCLMVLPTSSGYSTAFAFISSFPLAPRSFALLLIIIAYHIEVFCGAVAKLGSHSHDLRAEFKGEIGFVLESNTDVEGSIFHIMLNPIHDFVVDLRVSITQPLMLALDPLIEFCSFPRGDGGDSGLVLYVVCHCCHNEPPLVA